ncbi:hypothetical protein, partial [Microbispora rosea]
MRELRTRLEAARSSGEGRARLEAALLRDQVEILDLCAAEQDRLTAAQEAYEADPSPETLAAYEQAQRDMYGLRGLEDREGTERHSDDRSP